MDSNLLKARLISAKNQCENSDKPQFFGFLSEEERTFAENLLSKNDNIKFFGGCDKASRTVLGVFPVGLEPKEQFFPITVVTLKFRHQDKPTHRDFLGAVLALGIKREAIGDILIGEGFAVLFALNSVAKLILAELKTVGRVGVKAEIGFSGVLPEGDKMSEILFTVSSLRIDCIVSAICACSRNTAEELIAEKRVSINSMCCEKNTKTVNECDKITIRGKGKFTLKQIKGETKKGRLKIIVEKYN